MTVHVTLEEAQAKLAELLTLVREGGEVIIDQNGAAAAVLRPPERTSAVLKPDAPQPKRKLGAWAHLNLDVDTDIFLEPDSELEAQMEEPIWPQ